MKILFFAERVNLNLFKGDSLLLKRMAEGLAEKGHEIHAVCHGSSGKIIIRHPLNFWFYSKVFSFPLTSFFSFRKLFFLLKKEKFDLVVIKLPSFSGNNFWFNLKPLIESKFYLKIALELKKRKIPFFIFLEGITEKKSFVSSFMGCSKNQQFQLMKDSNGVISLSEKQNKLLDFLGLKKPKSFFPAPVDTKKYYPKKHNLQLNLSEKKINLLYLSSSCDLEDFISFFRFLNGNDCILYVLSPFSSASKKLQKETEKRNLSNKIVFLSGFSNEKLFDVIPSFDAGVYLKKFNFPFADASYMMKISEYLSCGLPVLIPEMKGPLIQAGKAGINFEKTKKVSKEELKKLSFIARNIAVENFDLEKNIQKIEAFLIENK